MTEHNEYQNFETNEIPCQEISDPAVLSKNPLVSVEMITYNHEPYIAQAIEGVLMQKANFPIELIIGEDCSTDRTREIVLDYQKKYPDIIRVITSGHNIGMIKNGFRTTKACCGKYIAFCEGDDYWTDSLKLQKQVDFLEANPDYGLVHCAADILIQKENRLIKWDKNNPGKIPQGYIFEDLLIFNFIQTLTVCVRRDLVLDYIAKIKPQEKNWMMGDRPMLLEISRHTKIGFIPESVGTRRVLENSAQHSPNIEYRMNFIKSSYGVRFFFIEKYGCSATTMKKVLDDYHNRILYYSFCIGDSGQAKTAFNYLGDNSNKIDDKVYLYYWGSKNSFRRFLVRAYFKVKNKVAPIVQTFRQKIT